jgi:hypothetical protein
MAVDNDRKEYTRFGEGLNDPSYALNNESLSRINVKLGHHRWEWHPTKAGRSANDLEQLLKPCIRASGQQAGHRVPRRYERSLQPTRNQRLRPTPEHKHSPCITSRSQSTLDANTEDDGRSFAILLTKTRLRIALLVSPGCPSITDLRDSMIFVKSLLTSDPQLSLNLLIRALQHIFRCRLSFQVKKQRTVYSHCHLTITGKGLFEGLYHKSRECPRLRSQAMFCPLAAVAGQICIFEQIRQPRRMDHCSAGM